MLERNRTSKLNRKRGAAMVEAVLVLPVLIALMFGIIELGLLMNDSMVLNQVARETLRSYAVGGSPSVTTIAGNIGMKNPANVMVTSLVTSATPGNTISISLSYQHPLIFWGGSKTLHASMVMRRE